MGGIWRLLTLDSIPELIILTTKSCLYSQFSDRDLNPGSFIIEAGVLPIQVGCFLLMYLLRFQEVFRGHPSVVPR